MATAAKTKKGFKSKARTAKPAGAENISPINPTSIQLRGPGAPAAYRPEYAKQAVYLCSLGATDEDLSFAFDVRPQTICEWRARYPEFAESLKVGKSVADDRVERSLYMNAVGYEYDAIEPMVVDKTIIDHRVRKRVLPNTSAQIFWLKNRRKDFWRDVHQLEHGRAGEFEALTNKELANRMQQSAKDLERLQLELSKADKDD